MKILILYNAMQSVWQRRQFIKELQIRGHEVIAAAPFDGWEERVQSIGVCCHNLQMSRWGVNPYRELSTLYQICRLLYEKKADLIICHTIKPIIYGSIASSVCGQKQTYSVVTGLGFMFVTKGLVSRMRMLLAKYLYRISLRSNEKVFFQNADDLSFFLRSNVVSKSQAVRVPGSGVDTTLFAPQEDCAQEARFVLIARMLWDKGVADYVEAARRLKRKYPFAVFDLVGAPDDNPASIPLAQLQSWKEEGAVLYHGYIEDIRPNLAKALVYVLPSFYREGIPRSNLEALAMGKAIITCDSPGCRETVEKGVNGFIVPPSDPGRLEEAMEIFIKAPDLARKMGSESRRLAVAQFELTKVNCMIVDVLEDGFFAFADSTHVRKDRRDSPDRRSEETTPVT